MRERIAQHPTSVRLEELTKLLEAYDWMLVRIASSHYIFHRAGQRLSIPRRKPHVLPVYVRQVLALTEDDDDH